ncbi:hypothetical protein AB4Z45_08530 [Paenibacillus sp. MCAF9]|uniref:hypothetical protein n=1 Tax=Paenibacillus sp. MCAF9 TaxID=3233046 RepID=UPI003F96A890
MNQVTGITAYQDVCAEIELLKMRAEDQERALKYARRKMHNSGLPWSAGQPVVVPLDKALQEYDEALTTLQETLEMLRAKENTRQRMEIAIGQIKGLDKAVEYQRDALGLPLKVIAERLGYSERHIKRISSRIPRRSKRTRKG